MKITDAAVLTVDLSQADPVEHRGLTGTSIWRTAESGGVRLRMVEYSAGYGSDHWCDRGHILLVLSGELHVELKDGRKISLGPGMSLCLPEDAQNPHYVSTEAATLVYIVD